MKWVQDPKTGKLHTFDEWARMNEPIENASFTVLPDIGDFENPQGKPLHGRKQLREDLKRQNCHIYERGERQYIDNMRAQHEKDAQRSLHRTVAEIAAERGLGVPD